jgi:cytochrome c553
MKTLPYAFQRSLAPRSSFLQRLGLLAASAIIASAAHAQDVKPGDAAAAKSKVAMCIGCHGITGYQASFPEVYKVPMIGGQGAKYIASALTAYRKGERKHPTMKGVAASLSDQDIADIAAFYEAQGKPGAAKAAPAPSPALQALLTKGNCAACHGADMKSPIDPSYPKLAGQHADYLYVALKSYQTEKNANIGRGNPIMAGQAKLFTHAELKQLAAYVASLSGDLSTVEQPKLR